MGKHKAPFVKDHDPIGGDWSVELRRRARYGCFLFEGKRELD